MKSSGESMGADQHLSVRIARNIAALMLATALVAGAALICPMADDRPTHLSVNEAAEQAFEAVLAGAPARTSIH
ncbi:MAG: hypothetical protein AAGL49_04730 [Pseudomonadota bacterium]